MSHEQAHVLVIDPDQASLGSTVAALATLDWPVRGALHAQGILALPQDSDRLPILVVLGESAASGGSGAITLARQIRAKFARFAPRILWVTGDAPRRVDLVHVDDVISRPYRSQELVARANRLLRVSGMFRLGSRSPSLKRANRG